MTPLHHQRQGLNKLLEDLYGRPNLVSEILLSYGFTHEQLTQLQRNIVVFTPNLIGAIETWGHETIKVRRTKILFLRYGLSGRKPQTLQKIAETYNLTPERIRQIQKYTLDRIHKKDWIPSLEQVICQTAEEILQRV